MGRVKIKNKKSYSSIGSVRPFDVPIIISNNKKRGNGRINCIEFDPSDENIWVAHRVVD